MTELDYGLLGYFGGKTVKESCVAFDGIEKKPEMKAKALSASLGLLAPVECSP